MAEKMGLRERKKLRTRRTLVEAGLRLFDEIGFDETTVTDICAAAEVAPATFYKHFPTKEDLVFADQPLRLEVVSEFLADRRPGRSAYDHVLSVLELAAAHPDWTLTSVEELTAIRRRLTAEVPALRAIALRWLFDSQEELGHALADAYPDELDRLTAHAIIGSVLGAMISASRYAEWAGLPRMESAFRGAHIALDTARPSMTDGNTDG